ncbi:transporter substrate-binding domain-containing protein [Roseobacter weihaiensis]|uniref:transporter substrate-binding domain-containing protein n=1 Tax=Roseobacter weihaiensis TaxID=2763262 RepID=UPI001D0A7C2C|nr:transporter substrate-binding domain-containing protein [Roseobacter sp. H9]
MLRAGLALVIAVWIALPGLAQDIPDGLQAQMPDVATGRLAHILQRGTLIVGVKDDYPPWGMRDARGAIVGLEPDLAQALADRMGVDLELEAVTATNRIGRVNQGRVDVIIATTADTAERREQADLLQPNYYSSGVVVYGRVDANLTGWEALRDQPVCLNRGAFYNRALEEDYGVQGQYYASGRDSQLALRQGRCVGWAFDDTALAQLIRAQALQGDSQAPRYEVATEAILVSPWAVLVAKGEGQGDLGRFISDMIAEWHASGRILALQDAWDIPRTAFIEEQHALWRSAQEGRTICARDPQTGLHPVACLSQAPIRAAPDARPQDWVVTLHQATGIDLRAVATPYNGARLLEALKLTLSLSALAIVGALSIGVVLALMQDRLAQFGWIGRLLLLPQRLLITVARMTPPILQLYIVFFGLGGLLSTPGGFAPGAFVIAAVILSLYAGATNTIILSHALQAEALARPDTGTVARLPGAITRGFDGLVAACVNIVKAAGMASAIAVGELVSTVDLLVSEGADTTTLMNGLLVFYFLLVLGLLSLFKALRRRLVAV